MNLSKNSKCELNWWIYNVQSSFKPNFRRKPDIMLESDSSLFSVIGDVLKKMKGDETDHYGQYNRGFQ